VASVLLPLVAVAVVLEALVLLPPPDFFHGWNPLPTAASASGGGLFDDNLLHWAANMAKGVPLNPGCSCNNQQVKHSISWLLQQNHRTMAGGMTNHLILFFSEPTSSLDIGSISSHYLMARVEIAEKRVVVVVGGMEGL
jgi:hypothetical protein